LEPTTAAPTKGIEHGPIRKAALWLAGAILIVLFFYLIGYIVGWIPHDVYVVEYNKDVGKSEGYVYETTWFIIIEAFRYFGAISPVIGALSTIGIFIFTGTLWHSTDKLWRETQRLAVGAEGQAKDFKESVGAARRSAQAAEDATAALVRSAENYKSTDRAWMAFDSVTAGRAGNDIGVITGVGFFISWINVGRSPALEVGVALQCDRLGPNADLDSFDMGDVFHRTDRVTIVGPTRGTGTDRFIVPLKDYEDARIGKVIIILRSFITYKDFFSEEVREAEVCFQVLPETKASDVLIPDGPPVLCSFISVTKHNRAT
jgi:hypothetical protein